MRASIAGASCIALLAVACASTGVPEVVLHNNYDGYPDEWVGMIIEEPSPGGEIVMMGLPTGETDLKYGQGIGLYERSGVKVYEEWGDLSSAPEGRPWLLRLTESRDSDEGREVVVLAMQSADGQPNYEVQAALELDSHGGYHLHQECYMPHSMRVAVALRDADLNVVQAWTLDSWYSNFRWVDQPVDDTVTCEDEITAAGQGPAVPDGLPASGQSLGNP